MALQLARGLRFVIMPSKQLPVLKRCWLAASRAASAQILVEERISGPEFSAFALLDGEEAVWLASAQDHKRAYDGDEGPNTGGMGAVSPSRFETDDLREQIMKEIIRPVAKGMAAEGDPYRGILYAGLMLTDKGPQVIEFNCRFGDPEAQVIFCHA